MLVVTLVLLLSSVIKLKVKVVQVLLLLQGAIELGQHLIRRNINCQQVDRGWST